MTTRNSLTMGMVGLLLLAAGCGSPVLAPQGSLSGLGAFAASSVEEHGYGAEITDDMPKLAYDEADGFKTMGGAGKLNHADLRPNCPPVRNQGPTSACTGFASAGFLEYMNQKKSGKFVQLSPRFVWNLNRQEFERLKPETHARKRNTGARTEDAMAMITKVGAPEESLFPMASRDQMVAWFKMPQAARAAALDEFATEMPGNDAFGNAKQYRLQNGFRTVNTLSQMKRALEWGSPVVLSMLCYESMDRDEVARTGRLPMPNPKKEKIRGGHAICAVGYDDQQRVVIIRNSWGTNWGDKGYFYMPYDYIKAGFAYAGFAAK